LALWTFDSRNEIWWTTSRRIWSRALECQYFPNVLEISTRSRAQCLKNQQRGGKCNTRDSFYGLSCESQHFTMDIVIQPVRLFLRLTINPDNHSHKTRTSFKVLKTRCERWQETQQQKSAPVRIRCAELNSRRSNLPTIKDKRMPEDLQEGSTPTLKATPTICTPLSSDIDCDCNFTTWQGQAWTAESLIWIFFSDWSARDMSSIQKVTVSTLVNAFNKSNITPPPQIFLPDRRSYTLMTR